jgi:hypothetical protein
LAKELKNKVREAVWVIFQPVQKGIYTAFAFYNKIFPVKYKSSFLNIGVWNNFPGVVTALDKNSINIKTRVLRGEQLPISLNHLERKREFL